MRISESRIRQIIREEARKVMNEGFNDGPDRTSQDVSLFKLMDALRYGNKFADGTSLEEVYPEAKSLLKKLESQKRDFDDGEAVIAPSKRGEGLDIFYSPAMMSDPVNDAPMPYKVLNFMGTYYNRGEGYSSREKDRRRLR